MAELAGTCTGSHDGEQQVVDDHLPEDLWQYRLLLRAPTPSAFGNYANMNNYPPGYSWILSRPREQETKGDEKMLQDLRNVFDVRTSRE